MGRVIQLTPTIDYGDAISNDIWTIHEILLSIGYDCKVYALGISQRVTGLALPAAQYQPQTDDIILYHMSIGSELSQIVYQASVKRKIMIYHNITPAHFFAGIDDLIYKCRDGRLQLKVLSPIIDFAFADSDYNKKELEQLGYRNTETLPLFFDKKTFLDTPANEKVLHQYKTDGFVNILFVGRIAPNKKQEDIIKSFFLYNRYINPKSRLFLVGNDRSMEKYRSFLEDVIRELNVANVIFPGHIAYDELLAYYRLADIFLCMSEHEGFCVPLLESMVFDVPIIAYASTAVPDTLKGSGVLINEKRYELIAEMINAVIENQSLRTAIIEKQRRRLDDFDYQKIKDLFLKSMSPLLSE